MQPMLTSYFTAKTSLTLVIFLTLFTTSFSVFSQEKKPKVALVLSGGGAKGIAHIPVLQKLDSLGIVPDLIVGTSMGSVIGGLYAAGYSGDSIAQLTQNVDWDKLLGGEVSLTDVSVEEKSEFGRYLVNFDVINGRPKIKAALLKDQNLREFLSALLYPVYDVTNFDDLSIPFRAVTTDLVNGKEVIMSKGSLLLAIRASMSIPSVFEPVRYTDVLLVDGGVLNNFPTDIAKKMGADIIIGSDVGGGLEPIEKLDNIATILFQTSMLTSNLRVPENRALCDVLINHYPNLTYSTQDFNSGVDIYKQGLIATHNSLPELEKLAQQIVPFPQRDHKLPDTKDDMVFTEIAYENISPENLSLVKARMALEPQAAYNSKALRKAIDRAMGTELFYQLTYRVRVVNGKNILILTGYEKSPNQISGALHYDTNQGVGLVVNYTGRNILGHSSRLLLGLDIAELPKFRAQYQQNIGDTKNWWWRAQLFGEKARQSFYSFGNKGDELKRNFFKSNLQFNRDVHTLYNYVGLDFNYEYTKIKPKLDPSINNNVYDLRRYSYKNLEVSAYFQHNSLDRVFFPTRGTFIMARLSRSVYNHADVEYDQFYEYNTNGSTNGFTKTTLKFEKRLPVNKSISLVGGVNSGLTFMDHMDSDELSFMELGVGAQYYLGGFLSQNRRDSHRFNGLRDSELIVTQFITARVAAQIQLLRNIYATPYLNLGSVGFGDADDYLKELFSPDGDWIDTSTTSFLFSGGTTLSYDSLLGPVNFDIAYLNNENMLNLFFSVGLKLSIP
ncbi:patatin-like phospholipase family protein [Hanstruepera marina]|uniref:patatin-like phospholipase family protein n=1 Tax=Hanstruepera marina TaxID=2873265 RepID=UPI002103DEBC|nr:patatin-like phospholipase family protein [Hanstruepera marina]